MKEDMELICKILNHSINEIYYKAIDNIIRKHPTISYKTVKEAIGEFDIGEEIQLLLYEAYTLLDLIKEAGISENNYSNMAKQYKHASKKILKLSLEKNIIYMLPKPSRVVYYLAYILHQHFHINQDEIKYILDILLPTREPNKSRMPKNKEDLNKKIQNSCELQKHLANTNEGLQKKLAYFTLSIFIFDEMNHYSHLVYDI
ncbi:hypothetical protein [Sulfurospirillum diekertiae]|uniref:Uncharacterized protein n=1 Tax=Sulfurospirillum diekertiae TaxID=1854492 RepID=A0AA92FGM1_9BACT|nr:hypothetical protein [Sulfurospirillum diekertiae]QIR75214.1 hypothetical protein FA584_02865 [Sulfurospirillum diekertiae]